MGATMGIVGKPWNRATVTTSGATITLDMVNRQLREFLASANIAAPKTWALANEARGFEFRFRFTISGGLHVQTMPADFEMTDPLWDPLGKTWTPVDQGDYEAHGKFNGTTTWYLTIVGIYD